MNNNLFQLKLELDLLRTRSEEAWSKNKPWAETDHLRLVSILETLCRFNEIESIGGKYIRIENAAKILGVEIETIREWRDKLYLNLPNLVINHDDENVELVDLWALEDFIENHKDTKLTFNKKEIFNSLQINPPG